MTDVASRRLERLAAVRQDPDYDRLRRRRPRTIGRHLAMAFGMLFGVLFAFMALWIRSIGGPAASRVGHRLPGAASASTLFQVVASLFVLVGAGVAVWFLFRWVRFAFARLEARPALVLDKRLNVSGGGSQSQAHTTYYVTVQFEGGERRELTVGGRLFGRLAQEDVGVAFVKDQVLLDLQRLEL